MRVVCSKCAYALESLIIDNKIALEDIGKKLNRHLEKEHSDEVKAMQIALAQVIPALMMAGPFTEFVFVPENETYVREKLEEAKGLVMAMLGFDLEENEVTEDDEDDDSEEDEEEVIESEPIEDSAPSTHVVS